MKKVIAKKIVKKNFGKGLIPDTKDERDLKFEDVLGAAAPVMTDADWKQGYDVEKALNIKIPFKNQQSSESCVGNGFSYYIGVLNAKEVGHYDDVSAKSLYSQIFLPGGGAQLRDAAKLTVNFGALLEKQLSSYKPDGTTNEAFMEDKKWITPALINTAKVLQTKTYLTLSTITMDIVARAIKDNMGIVGGVGGSNNGTWYTNEPKAPTSAAEWYHCLYFGKFGVDALGKYIATPNSWGTRNEADALHPDDWQKLRADWFANNAKFLINPWTLTDKANIIDPNLITTMAMIKKQGEATVYAQVSNILIPFTTDWATYQLDFKGVQIKEISPTEFAKFKIAGDVVITKKI